MSEQNKYWFLARVCKGQELIVCTFLTKLGVECFFPTRFVVRQLKINRRRVEIPIMGNLIFMYATKAVVSSLTSDSNLPLTVITQSQTSDYWVISEAQMKRLKRSVHSASGEVIVNEELFNQLIPE